MDSTTVGIFFGVWLAVTLLIVLGCKLFARFCYQRWGIGPTRHPEAGSTTNNVTIVINGPPAPTDPEAVPTSTDPAGAAVQSPGMTRRIRLMLGLHNTRQLHRQRSHSLSAVEVLRRDRHLHERSAASHARHMQRERNELPPTYHLAVSHPSIYRKKASLPEIYARQDTLPPPPHYDDLQMETSFGVDMHLGNGSLQVSAMPSSLSASTPNLALAVVPAPDDSTLEAVER